MSIKTVAKKKKAFRSSSSPWSAQPRRAMRPAHSTPLSTEPVDIGGESIIKKRAKRKRKKKAR